MKLTVVIQHHPAGYFIRKSDFFDRVGKKLTIEELEERGFVANATRDWSQNYKVVEIEV